MDEQRMITTLIGYN